MVLVSTGVHAIVRVVVSCMHIHSGREWLKVTVIDNSSQLLFSVVDRLDVGTQRKSANDTVLNVAQPVGYMCLEAPTATLQRPIQWDCIEVNTIPLYRAL